LALLFAGVAAGKLVCGFLGARLGVLAIVLLTSGLVLAPLPMIGGTSSVLCGTVPDLVSAQRRETAFDAFTPARSVPTPCPPHWHGG